MVKIRKAVRAASDANDFKTTFYKITYKKLIEAYEEYNLFIYELLLDKGMDAIDIDLLYGSAIIDDVLYLCDTDGKDIPVGSKLVDPEKALEECSLEDLASYIKPLTSNEDILKKVTEYEFDQKLLDSNVDDYAIELLKHKHPFAELIEHFQEIYPDI